MSSYLEASLICLVAFVAAGLTLFSGFGLGTLLMPVFALFWPVETAVALTAVVHLFNNLLKLALLGKHAQRTVVLQFGVPAIVEALLGAWVLRWLSNLEPVTRYHLFSRELSVVPLKVVIAVLLVVFVLLEITPATGRFAFDKKYLPLGGVLSGFFGGLSGHQGALRSAFLIKCGLSKESFLGTGVVIACLVDLARLFMYGATVPSVTAAGQPSLLLTVVVSASLGTILGSRFLAAVTLRAMQILVSVMLFGIAVGLAAGLI
ncbi:MAG: TSUP family transporter [Nitrospiraceae bacterium]